MSETRRDALVADVQKALESAYDTGWECGTGDVMREVTAGEELASVIVQKVTAARDAEIREALLSDRAVGILLTAVEDDSVLAMALSARKQRGDSVVCTATLNMGRDWLTAALAAIGLGDGTGGRR